MQGFIFMFGVMSLVVFIILTAIYFTDYFLERRTAKKSVVPVVLDEIKNNEKLNLQDVHDKWIQELEGYENSYSSVVDILESAAKEFNQQLSVLNLNAELIFESRGLYGTNFCYFKNICDVKVQEILPNGKVLNFEMPSVYLKQSEIDLINKLFIESYFYLLFNKVKTPVHSKEYIKNNLNWVKFLIREHDGDILMPCKCGERYPSYHLMDISNVPNEIEIGQKYDNFKKNVEAARKVAFDEERVNLFSGEILDIDIIENWQNYM